MTYKCVHIFMHFFFGGGYGFHYILLGNLWSPTRLKITIEMYAVAAAAKSLQSCLTLCDPRDGSPPGSSVHGILQARILEWVAVPSSRGSSHSRDRSRISYVFYIGPLLATPWTAAYQAPPSTGFSRQEYWSGVPLPSPIEMYTLP